MKDRQGREIDYMRISITDRCNLRCRYCMPDGIETVPKGCILSLEEIQAAAICAARLGIRFLKVTGGEPLVRKDCCHLIQTLKGISGIEKVTLTTNGVLLEPVLEELKSGGIDGINISLDTLDRKTYETITGKDCLNQVLSAVEAAVKLKIPVKLNAVSLDLGKDHWTELTELARRLPVDVRLIELMPIGHGKDFPSMDHRLLFAELKKQYPGMEEDRRFHGPGPAVYYQIPGFAGTVGFISAVHGKFCASCNRVRLTSQGFFKPCLCYEDGVDLRPILRAGCSAPENGHFHWPETIRPDDKKKKKRLEEAMKKAIWEKPKAHCFEHPGEITEAADMVSIGG